MYSSLNYLSKFIEKSKQYGLSIGLAGKLNKSQVPKLLKLKPKIIGFRSAVCEKNDRNEKISEIELKKKNSWLFQISHKLSYTKCRHVMRSKFFSLEFLALISFSASSIDEFLIFFFKIFLPIPVKSSGVFFF